MTISLREIIQKWQITLIHAGTFGFSFVLRDIMPGRIMKSEIICTPTRLGERKIVAKLISNQIKGISTEKGIIITE